MSRAMRPNRSIAFHRGRVADRAPWAAKQPGRGAKSRRPRTSLSHQGFEQGRNLGSVPQVPLKAARTELKGCGRKKDESYPHHEQEVVIEFTPKVKIEEGTRPSDLPCQRIRTTC
jgi:hypothetical protein